MTLTICAYMTIAAYSVCNVIVEHDTTTIDVALSNHQMKNALENATAALNDAQAEIAEMDVCKSAIKDALPMKKFKTEDAE